MRNVCLLAVMLTAALHAQPKAAPAAQPAKPSREPGLYATMNTTQGTIVIKLFEKEAPATVRNFADLARGRKPWQDPKTHQTVTRPLFNGLTFHRVIPGFMIQGGDPTGTGMGDCGLKPIPDEFAPSLKFDVVGRLAMANAGPGTSTCQFFITDSKPEYLNGKHTIFGQVVEGQEIVTKIAAVPRDSNDKPRTPVRIVSMVIKREGAPAAPKPAAAKKTSTAK